MKILSVLALTFMLHTTSYAGVNVSGPADILYANVGSALGDQVYMSCGLTVTKTGPGEFAIEAQFMDGSNGAHWSYGFPKNNPKGWVVDEVKSTFFYDEATEGATGDHNLYFNFAPGTLKIKSFRINTLSENHVTCTLK